MQYRGGLSVKGREFGVQVRAALQDVLPGHVVGVGEFVRACAGVGVGALIRVWVCASVCASVRVSVRAVVRASVCASECGACVRAFAGVGVGASVRAWVHRFVRRCVRQ